MYQQVEEIQTLNTSVAPKRTGMMTFLAGVAAGVVVALSGSALMHTTPAQPEAMFMSPAAVRVHQTANALSRLYMEAEGAETPVEETPVEETPAPEPVNLGKQIEDYVGGLPPVGTWDPLQLTKDMDPSILKRYREAELKHGRISMLAALGIVAGDLLGNGNGLFFDGKISGIAINQFQQADDMDDKFWVKVLFGIALVEGTNIIKGWETVDNVAGLKDNYENGDLGFDPLNLKPSDPASYKTLQEKELSNGRLAMIGVAGMVVQELITQQPIFG